MSNTIDEQIAALRQKKQEAQWDEYVEKFRPKYKALVNTFYKYYNSYGGDRPQWWLYKALTRFIEGDHVDYLIGEQFETSSSGNSEWKTTELILGGGYQQSLTDGWVEIDELEFLEARGAFTTEMTTHKQHIKELLKS